MRPLVGRGRTRNGDTRRLERLHLRQPRAELFLVESCTGVADVLEPAVSSYTPSSSAPNAEREPRGSVQPPTTNSWVGTSFSLPQSGERLPDL